MLMNSSEMIELAVEHETAKIKKMVTKNTTMFKKMRDRSKKTVLLTNLDPQSSTSTGRTHKPLSAKKAKDSTFNIDDNCNICCVF